MLKFSEEKRGRHDVGKKLFNGRNCPKGEGPARAPPKKKDLEGVSWQEIEPHLGIGETLGGKRHASAF